jgi:hypothetical protein
MARLTKAARDAIPSSQFAGPGRSFPIEDAAHAKAAIMLSGHASNPSAIRAKARAKLESFRRSKAPAIPYSDDPGDGV